jgi:hypothetical protein
MQQLHKKSALFALPPLLVQCLHFEHCMHFDLRPCWHSLCGLGIASYSNMDRDRRKRDEQGSGPKANSYGQEWNRGEIDEL